MHIYYLNKYEQRISEGASVPLVVDILNCSNGCNLSSAIVSSSKLSIDDCDEKFNELKR